MKLLRLIAVSCLFAAGGAGAQGIDFVSPDGPARTCPKYLGLEPARLRSDADRVAYAICNTIDLVREAASRFRTYNERGDNALVSDLRARLEHILKRVHASRLALEGVRGAGPYFTIRPGEWAIDWNGDGSIDATEKYLLWVPKRGRTEFRARSAFPSEAAYNEENFASPQIRVDRADIYWAAAYMQFFEAALNLVLSYEVDLSNPSKGFDVRLKDGARISKVAYGDLLGGLRASAQLRQALLKETDDDDEWIPNPKQTRSAFPLLMDAQTFATWGELLGHMEKLFRGQTLLGGAVESQEFRGVRDLAGGICAPGEGIDVKSLFTDPIPAPFAPDALKSRCRAPSAARPLTGLAAMIAESVRRNGGRTPASFSGEWMILRHFYWVN